MILVAAKKCIRDWTTSLEVGQSLRFGDVTNFAQQVNREGLGVV